MTAHALRSPRLVTSWAGPFGSAVFCLVVRPHRGRAITDRMCGRFSQQAVRLELGGEEMDR